MEGMPAGLELTEDGINRELARRQLGYGRGGRMKIEEDRAEVVAGIRHGKTLGSPVAVRIANLDYVNWEERMGPWQRGERVEEVHLPRPGHADLAGMMKFGHSDARNVLERASARETAARVAAGALAKILLSEFEVSLHSHVVRIGSVASELAPQSASSFEGVDDSPVRCIDEKKGEQMVAEIDTLRKGNESVGGEFEVWAFGLIPGLGSYARWSERLDARISQALASIPAIKAVSIGAGFELASLPGSKAHDEIYWSDERGYFRQTNRAGGIEGGMTNGEPIVARAAMKPLPTLTKPLQSVDTETKEPAPALKERTDSCAVPAAAVVAEAMVALVVAGAFTDKLGGDSLDDMKRSYADYKKRINWRS